MASSRRKRQHTVDKIEAGKAEVLRLIREHNGLYPFNGGSLNQAEFCRIAGVDPTLLAQPTHKETTRKKVNEWLDDLSRDLITGKHRVRGEVTGRVTEWKKAYDEVLTSFSIVELELENAARLIRELQDQVRQLGGTPCDWPTPTANS